MTRRKALRKIEAGPLCPQLKCELAHILAQMLVADVKGVAEPTVGTASGFHRNDKPSRRLEMSP